MGSAVIFNGQYAKVLANSGVKLKNGHIIDSNGDKNYITNGEFEVDATGWSTYDDGASAVPVDATGGSPSSTFGRNTTTPLAGAADGKFTISANSQGEGFVYSFNVEALDVGQVRPIEFVYKTDSDFVNGDVGVYIVSTTGGVVKVGDLQKNDTTPYKSFLSYYAVRADETQKLVFHCQANNAAATDLWIKNVKISPNPFNYIDVVEQESYISDEYAGMGATNTRIPYFNTAVRNTMSSLGTVDNSSTLGWSFTAKKKCRFTMTYATNDGSADKFLGISLNSSQLSTDIETITNEDRLSIGKTAQINGYVTAAADVILNPGDVVRPHHGSGGISNLNRIKLLATATSVSENVVFSGEAGTEWTTDSNGVQISATTTAPTKATSPNLDKARWTRVSGSGNAKVRLEYFDADGTGAAAGSGDYLFKMPSGLKIDTTKLTVWTDVEGAGNYQSKGTVIGTFQGNWAGIRNAIGTVFAYDADYVRVAILMWDGTPALQGTGVLSSGLNPINTHGHSLFLDFEVPILGWSSLPRTFAVPTSRENNPTATIANNGTATISTTNMDWINSVTRTVAGKVTVNYAKLGLTAIPKITATLFGHTDNKRIIWVTNATTTSAEVWSQYADSSTFADGNFTIDLDKQGADYTPQGVLLPMSVVPMSVAVIRYAASSSRTTVSNSADTSTLSPLDVVSGDTHIVSLASNQMTLQAGKYKISWVIPIYTGNLSVNTSTSYLRNATDASTVGYGSVTSKASGEDEMHTTHGVEVVSISSTKAFEIYQKSIGAGSGSSYIGDTFASPNSTKTIVTIEQLAKY